MNEITEVSISSCIKTINDEITPLRGRVTELLGYIALKEATKEDLVKIQTKALSEEQKKLKEIEELKNKLQFLETREQLVKVYEGQLEDKKTELEKVKSWDNPYTRLSQEVDKEIQSLSSKLKELDSTVSEMQDIKRYYEFWSEGFSNKGIKSFIFDSLIPGFTARTNKYLNLLTEKNISVLFDTQREKKISQVG